MPQTTDWMHTRQDRWIQKELALAPAKNATTLNPFKMIPLQSTRKENSWETEETLVRAAVTVEMEQAKWPNSWCLWWWRWWCHFDYDDVCKQAELGGENESQRQVLISHWKRLCGVQTVSSTAQPWSWFVSVCKTHCYWLWITEYAFFCALKWNLSQNCCQAIWWVAYMRNYGNECYGICWSQWPRDLRYRSMATCLLRSWVLIPPGVWMFVCCVLSGRGLCDELITRPEETYWLWHFIVCDQETLWTRRP
jgi:hypothetical protein